MYPVNFCNWQFLLDFQYETLRRTLEPEKLSRVRYGKLKSDHPSPIIPHFLSIFQEN